MLKLSKKREKEETSEAKTESKKEGVKRVAIKLEKRYGGLYEK